MKNQESAFDKVMRIGKEISILVDARALDMDMAVEAEKKAAEEINNAALAGDESAYAEAKRRHSEAQNRLEILQIQRSNNVPVVDLTEAHAALDAYVTDARTRLQNAFSLFLTQYDELCKIIDLIENIAAEYNKVVPYYKNYVLKTQHLPYQEYAVLMFPINTVTDMKKRFAYQRENVEKFVGKK